MSSLETTGDLRSCPLVINQPEEGYRYNTDSFLLASFVTLKKHEKVIDLGSGVGVIGLLLSERYPDCSFWGIEIQERLFRYAEENRRENGLEKRVVNILGDYRKIEDLPGKGFFDVAVSNPPYRPVGTGRQNRDDECAVARHETAGGLADMVTAARSSLKSRGRLFMIYPAWRTVDCMICMQSGGFEPKRARFIHTRKDEDAQAVMIEARCGGGRGLTVLPPLYIWEATGVYTDEVRRMLEPTGPNSY